MAKTASSIVGLDLGNFSLKAVRLQKKSDGQYALAQVALLPMQRDASGQALVTEQSLGAQIKEVANLVRASGAEVHVTVNSPNATIRYVDLPAIPLDDVRAALRLNSATYLRQSFENYTFDVCPLDAESAIVLKGARDKKKGSAGHHSKMKVLVSGIPNAEAVLYFHSVRRAGLRPKTLQLSPISLTNGFEVASPDIFGNESVAILDLGMLSTSLTILDRGKPLLTRVVPAGGRHLIDFIVQMNGVAANKVEDDLKSGQSAEQINQAISQVWVNLVREIKSSINFFEKNTEQIVSKICVSGALAQSQAVVDGLTQNTSKLCEAWDLTGGMLVELPVEQQGIFQQNRSAFCVALGIARTYTVIGEFKPRESAGPAVSQMIASNQETSTTKT